MAGQDLVLEFEDLDKQRLVFSTDTSGPGIYLTREHLAASKSHSIEFISTCRDRLIGLKAAALLKHPADRVVRISFNLGAGSPSLFLLASFRGRATNACLFDSESVLLSKLFNRAVPDDPWPEESGATLSPDGATESSMSGGSAARFGPRLNDELDFRCRDLGGDAASRARVMSELLKEAPDPIVYSSIPIEEIGSRAVDPSVALVLSSIELTGLRDYHEHRFKTLSEAAAAYYKAHGAAVALYEGLTSLKRELAAAIKKKQSLLRGIESDLERFAGPDRFKQIGDLILANLTSAKVTGASIRLIDYFDSEQPEIEVALPQNKTLQQAAAHYYSMYGKAKRATEVLVPRAKQLTHQLDQLSRLLTSVLNDPTASKLAAVRASAEQLIERRRTSQTAASPRGKNRAETKEPGRRFKSSDGYEIIVGRTDAENDAITFRLAGSQDIWLHAADYPGSHVVIRNPRRQEVPRQTVVEAAQLAAFYSSARNEKKAAVHYTRKKYVTKPPRSKPGLVRLSSFKTVMVEPSRRV